LPGIEELRKAALLASGDAATRDAWQLKGPAKLHGADQTFEMTFDSRFRFRMRVDGAVPEMFLFDGSNCWRLLAWTLTGAWAERSAPLSLQAATAGPDEQAILLMPRDGVVSATLILDSSTTLPKSLRYWSDEGDETWTFTHYTRFGERMLPTHIAHRVGEQDDLIEITSAAKLTGAAPSFRLAKRVPDPAEYDANVSAQVEIKRIYGHLFVRPRVDGQELGWFFLDTGADVMCLDPGYARKLHLPLVGGDATAGIVAVTHMDFCRAGTFQLGPITLKTPVFLEVDLAAISRALNLPIAGICGYDFISRAVLDIDPSSEVIQVLKPGKVNPVADLPTGIKWTRIGFDSNTPVLECRFAGDRTGVVKRGYFRLDTGSGSTIDFCTPAVEKLQLLARADKTRPMSGGAGGSAESRQGRIDWFDLAGTRFKSPLVGFQLTRVGSFASPYLTGNIGMGLLSKFRLVIDYANERIALLPGGGPDHIEGISR
jgi:hypothetical protein